MYRCCICRAPAALDIDELCDGCRKKIAELDHQRAVERKKLLRDRTAQRVG